MRILLLSCLALAVIGCSGGGPAAASQGRDQRDGGEPVPGALQREAAPKVLVDPIVQREMVRELSTTTVAESEREIEIFARTSGVATELRVEEGDRVNEGEVLLVLDQREVASALEEAEIAKREAEDAKHKLELAVAEATQRVESSRLTFEQAKRELERKESAGQGLLSKNELEQLQLTRDTRASELEGTRHALASAEAAVLSQDIVIDRAALMVAQAELNLSFTEVTAPFAGVIAERKVKVGDLVTNASGVFVLTDSDNVRAVVYRPQRELAFFHAAERAKRASRALEDGTDAALASAVDIQVEPEAIPGTVYGGTILFVSPTIDAESGQFRLTIGLEQPAEGDPRPPILPGMLLRVSIVTERHPDALVVPKRALLREGESHFVFVVKDKKARRLKVREGFAGDMHIEIHPAVEGSLAPGDLVVVVGNRDLEDDDTVDAEPWKPLIEETPGDGEEAATGGDVDGGTDSEADSKSEEPAVEEDSESAATDGSEAVVTAPSDDGATEPEQEPDVTQDGTSDDVTGAVSDPAPASASGGETASGHGGV